MIINLIKKKHVDRILKILGKEKELYFGQLGAELNIDPSSLNKILKEMYSLNLVNKREEKSDYKLAKVYYSLSPLGIELLKRYEYLEELDNLKESKDDNSNSKNIQTNNTGTIINNVGDINGDLTFHK
ncbi:DNA-binding HxlR family transcriptional regulator [Methanococcus voltae]|uniref:MarR family transcriptional regulator n=1 Tax=Methanococcus voltae TaxID=2188 RepID=UPI001AE271D1|nr:MarR family transcriptional regulator [Methanococcus voltae]MBP2143819.1 DNA-binding HxlR family transcriptional regulator [Methanococcus voltae]